MFTCNSVKTNGTNFLGRTKCVLSAVLLYNMPLSLLINNFLKPLKKPLASLDFVLISAPLSVTALFCRSISMQMTPSSLWSLLKSIVVSDFLDLPPVYSSSVSKSVLILFTFGTNVSRFCAWFTIPSNIALTLSAEHNPQETSISSTLLIVNQLNISATTSSTPGLQCTVKLKSFSWFFQLCSVALTLHQLLMYVNGLLTV